MAVQDTYTAASARLPPTRPYTSPIHVSPYTAKSPSRRATIASSEHDPLFFAEKEPKKQTAIYTDTQSVQGRA